MLLAACAETRVEFRPAAIDPTLLTPCPEAELQGETLADVGAFIVRQTEALRCANGKIEAIADTIRRQEGPR